MSATADSIRELHALHQRAKALRDRLTSGPKTLAARRALLASRQSSLEEARKALKDLKAHNKNKEVQIQQIQAKADDLRVRLNTVKKQDEYNAIVSQIASDNRNIARLEDEVLEAMSQAEADASALAASEAEVKALGEEVEALAREIEAKAAEQRASLESLEKAIVEAEEAIPADQRDQYRRVVKQRGADALAAAEDGACTGCFVAVTPQMMNELINGGHIVFCKTCGRVLYLADHDQPNTRRTAR